MCSALPPDDRTAAARIRDTAIERFGEVGFEKTTIRDIAKAAGVSPGLILHHFGSKAGLREACDDHVVAEFARARTETVESATTDPFAAMAGIRGEKAFMRYMLQSLREGSPAAARLFDGLVEESVRLSELSVEHGQLRASENLYDQTVILVAWQFGGLLLMDHVARAFDTEPYSDDMTKRYARGVLEVLTHGVFADSRYEEAWSRLDQSKDTKELTNMTAAIETVGLVKDFGEVRALDGLDLNVTQGEVHGFLGPNGAGKTTTIRILLGLLRADAGTAELLGGDPWNDAVELHRRLAYVPGDVELWPKLSGGEAIDLFGRLRGGMDKLRRDDLVERFDLDPSKKGRTYSKGNRQKVALISALASNAELLLLDEPTAGLDPLMEAVFQEVIREMKEEGRTVLLSSHILAQVEVLADRISIIRHGKVVETGSLSELRHLKRTSVIAETELPAQALAQHPGIHNFEAGDGQVRFDVDAEQLDSVVRELAPLGVRSLVSHPPTLEQLLLRHYGDELEAHLGNSHSANIHSGNSRSAGGTKAAR